MKSTEGKRDRNVKTFTHVNLNVEQVEVVDVIDWHTIGQMSLEEHSQLMTIGFGSNAFGIPLIVIKTMGCGHHLVALTQ